MNLTKHGSHSKYNLINSLYKKGIAILNKSFSSGPLKNDRATTHTTYDVGSQDELSEGRLSSDDDEDVIERFNAKIERFEAEKDMPKDETVKPSG
jgi:hypothetical protein